MTTTLLTRGTASAGSAQRNQATLTLATALLGLFVVTLDAVVVNVALPTIRTQLGGGITGLQQRHGGHAQQPAHRRRGRHGGCIRCDSPTRHASQGDDMSRWEPQELDAIGSADELQVI